MNTLPSNWLDRMGHRARRGAAIALLLLATAPASAHDTWFAVRAQALPGNVVLTLGTGDQFPTYEFTIPPAMLARHGCRQGAQSSDLTPVAQAATALVLRTRAATAEPLVCWAQLEPSELVLAPDKIGVYLDEIDAGPELRATWAVMAARGKPWKERYTKHSRVLLAGAGAPSEAPASVSGLAAVASTAWPTPMDMDVLLESPVADLREGRELVFRVLREGQPLAGFSIELRGAAAGSARWLRTDAEGRVRFRAPAAGRWVLRGTDLRLTEGRPDEWDSRWINLAFEIRPARLPGTP